MRFCDDILASFPALFCSSACVQYNAQKWKSSCFSAPVYILAILKNKNGGGLYGDEANGIPLLLEVQGNVNFMFSQEISFIRFP